MEKILHHAIIVTSNYPDLIREAHIKACEIFKDITEITEIAQNGYSSFLVTPDGSKEGWSLSDLGNRGREIFKIWLESKCLKNGDNFLKYIEVQFKG